MQRTFGESSRFGKIENVKRVTHCFFVRIYYGSRSDTTGYRCLVESNEPYSMLNWTRKWSSWNELLLLVLSISVLFFSALGILFLLFSFFFHFFGSYRWLSSRTATNSIVFHSDIESDIFSFVLNAFYHRRYCSACENKMSYKMRFACTAANSFI